MKVFFLFAPAFHEWPIAIARELRRRDSRAECCGLVTGPRRVYERIAGAEDARIAPLDRLDDLERRWLAASAEPARLDHYETLLGAEAVRRIIIADRELGYGFVSGGLWHRTLLIERAAAPEMVRRYLLGLLDYVFERLSSERPDLVFCYAVAGAPAMALAIVARHLGIPFARLTHTRVDGRHVIDDSPLGLLNPVRRRYQQTLGNPANLGSRLDEARRHIAAFRSTTRTPDYVAFSSRRWRQSISLKALAHEALAELRNVALRALKRQPVDLREARPFVRIRHRMAAAHRARRIMSRGIFRAVGDLPPAPFAYYPLHVDPEASTMVLAPMHTDQLAVVEALAKSLPLSINLVVKEHLPMVGLRPAGFYQRLAGIPGVVLASPLEDSISLVRQAALTAVITGTAAWEAMLLQRPVLVVGDFPYSAVGQGYVQCQDLSKLPEAIVQALHAPPADDERLAIYLASLFDVSFDFPTELFWGKVTPATTQRNSELVQAMTDRLVAVLRDGTSDRGEHLSHAQA